MFLLANNNAFTSVPLAMGSMSALTTVNIASNQLVGVLTDQFEGCGALESLDISQNSLSGPLPPLVGCASITSLNIHHCSFNGTIPFAWKTNLPSLVTLNAAHNEIVSPVAGIGSLTLLEEVDLRSAEAQIRIAHAMLFCDSALTCHCLFCTVASPATIG